METFDKESGKQPVDHAVSTSEGLPKSKLVDIAVNLFDELYKRLPIDHGSGESNESSKSQPIGDAIGSSDDPSKSQLEEIGNSDSPRESQPIDHAVGASDEPSKSQPVDHAESASGEPSKSQPIDHAMGASDKPSKSHLVHLAVGASGEQSKSQLDDHEADVSNDLSTNQPNNHEMEASNESSKSQEIEYQTSASNGPSKSQNVDRNLDATITSQPLDNNLGATIGSPNRISRSTCSQVVATLIENTLLIDVGIQMAIPSLVLGALYGHPAEKLNMNDDQASWFGSLPHFFHFIGSFVSGYLQEQFGRKGTMVFINIPILAAFLTLYFADSQYALFAVVITSGLCCGLIEAPTHAYCGEIGTPHIRGTLSTLVSSAVIIGYILMYFIGYLVDWRTAALIVSVVPVISFVLMTQIPESPTWLIRKNRLDDAQKSLAWVRGWVKPADVQEEFQELVEYVQNSTKKSKIASESEKESPYIAIEEGYLKTKFREITDRKVLLPLRMVFIAFIISNSSNFTPVRPYIVGILDGFGFPINSLLILVISRLCSFVGSMTNVVFLRRFGKRKMSFFAYGSATTSIFLLGIYSSFLQGSNWFPGLVWVPMILIVIIDFCSGLCVNLLPWWLVSEVFPVMGRGFASGISAAWAYVVVFVMSKMYLYVKAWIEFEGVMYLLGAMSVLGLLYYYFYLPETEGKSLEQIETYFTADHDQKEKFSIGKSQDRICSEGLKNNSPQSAAV